MTPRSLSFVLPITLRENLQHFTWRGAPDTACGLRCRLLLRSFLRAFPLAELAQFLIVCPAADKEQIRAILRPLTTDSRFQLIDELALCPELGEQRTREQAIPGWYIQQLLKLAAADAVTTPFYLTLDSDIVCRKPFSIASLIPAGQALLNIETPRVYRSLYKEKTAQYECEVKRRQLRHAATLLGYRRRERYHYQSYGETPVLLHTASTLDLRTFLTERYGNWFHGLAANPGWSEYSLFFQFLEMTGTLEKLYRRGDHNTVLDLESSIWKINARYKESRDNSPESLLAGKNRQAGPFVAIQSYLDSNQWLPPGYPDLPSFYAALEGRLFDRKPS